MAIRDFKNKVVVVTGAAAGIGRSTALAFAREGATIVASDLRAETQESLKQEVEALGVPCMTHAVDVSDEAGMKAFAEAVQARFGAPARGDQQRRHRLHRPVPRKATSRTGSACSASTSWAWCTARTSSCR